MFSFRNLFVLMLGLAFLISALFVYVVSRTYYQSLVRTVINERSALIEIIGTTFGFSPLGFDTVAPANGSVQKAFSAIVHREQGITFVRLVAVPSGRVVISTVPDEEGRSIAIPTYALAETRVDESRVAENGIIDITYGYTDGSIVWMGIDRAFLVAPAMTMAYQFASVTTVLMLAFGIGFFFLSRSLFILPLRQLSRSLDKASRGDFDIRLPTGPPNEFAHVFASFNRMAEAVEVARRHDHEVAQMKTDFIAIAAHQLRTPLSAVRWALDLVLDEGGQNLTTKQRHMLTKGRESAFHIIQLVNDLLNVDRIEHEVTDLHYELVEVCQLLADIIDTAQSEAVQRSITIQQGFALTDCANVWADPSRLTIALTNIMHNALRYTQNGGAINVDLSTTDQYVCIRISDTGIGIPEEYQEKLFTKFYRAPNAVRYVPNGSGLGLYLAREIIRRHAGTITLVSSEHNGTTVSVRLPVRR